MAKKIKWGEVATNAAALTVGAIGTGYVNKFVPIKNERIKSFIPLVVGGFLMSRKGKFVQGIGAGMLAKGGSDLAQSFGIGEVPIQDDVMEVMAILEEQQQAVDEGYYDDVEEGEVIDNVPLEGFEDADLY